MRIHYNSDLSRIKVLVITQKKMAEDVLEHLQKHLEINYQIIGIAYTDQEDVKTINDIPVICMNDRFMEDVTLMALDEVFIYAPELKQTQIQMLISGFDVMGVNSHYCMELPGMNAERSKVDDFGGYSVLTYTRFQSSYKRLLIKRVMDIIGGLVGMLITLLFFHLLLLRSSWIRQDLSYFPRSGSAGMDAGLRSINSVLCISMQRSGRRNWKSRTKYRGLCLKWKMIPALPKWADSSERQALTSCLSFIMW